MTDFKVKDINQAEFGRKEISLAETEMPGLMALRKEYKGKHPLKGARIVGCLPLYSLRKAINPGISVSASEISFLPNSAWLISLTLKSVMSEAFNNFREINQLKNWPLER